MFVSCWEMLGLLSTSVSNSYERIQHTGDRLWESLASTVSVDECFLTRKTHLLLAFPKYLVLCKAATPRMLNTPHMGKKEFLASSL